MPAGAPTTTHEKETKHKQQPAAPVLQGPEALIETLPLFAPGVQRAMLDPGRARAADILALQRVAGNRAVSRLIQPKLIVGPAGNIYEQEADRAAEQVVGSQWPTAQRQEDGQDVQAKPLVQQSTGSVGVKPDLSRQSLLPQVTRRQADVVQRGIRSWFKKKTHQKFGWYKDWARTQEEKQQYQTLRGQYQDIVGRRLPEGLPLDQARRRVRQYQDQITMGAGQWLLRLAHDVDGLGLETTDEKMDALFTTYIKLLRKAGFVYQTKQDSTLYTDPAASACCQNLSQGLVYAGELLGLPIQVAVLSQEPFATPPGQALISDHTGNVRLEGQTKYTDRRFVFVNHVVVKCGGKYYDPTVPANKGFTDLSQEVAWRLRENGTDRYDILQATGEAMFPNRTKITAQTAYLMLDTQKQGASFSQYWIVKKK
jgi:hypothetical protein